MSEAVAVLKYLTPADQELIRPATGEDEAEIIAELATGRTHAVRHQNGSIVIARHELDEIDDKWLVLVAGAGADLRGVVGWWCEWADKNGYNVRLHTKKKGIGRMVENLGFGAAETVYKRRL